MDKVENTVTGAKVKSENTLKPVYRSDCGNACDFLCNTDSCSVVFCLACELVLGVNITLPQIGKKKKEGKRI